MQEQLQQKTQDLAASEAARLREMTRKLRPTIIIDTTNTPPPSNEEELWVKIGRGILTNSMPYSPEQQFTTISHVLSQTFHLKVSEKWDPVLTELQLRSAELLFDFGCNMMSIANAKEVLKRHPKNTRALQVVKDVRALPQ